MAWTKLERFREQVGEKSKRSRWEESGGCLSSKTIYQKFPIKSMLTSI